MNEINQLYNQLEVTAEEIGAIIGKDPKSRFHLLDNDGEIITDPDYVQQIIIQAGYKAFRNGGDKNIIFMIGDGMGVAHTTSYRYFADDKATKEVERTVFDELLVGTSSTDPDDNTYVTDSAASATALSSGVKSYNGAIGVDVNKKPVLTLLERAKQLGKNTGIVSSSQINHATPASFIAPNETRRNYNPIADAYTAENINYQTNVDSQLCGGQSIVHLEHRTTFNV